ncbi:hypothetical protein ACS0TY_027123 [Phlomoides rotata]
METTTVSVPKLPDDLIIEILARLPVKPLLKFRCVSKSWLSLISSKQFIKTHLKNSKNCTDFATHRIILRCRDYLKQCLVHPLLYEPITEVFDTDYPVELSRKPSRVVGSCDGLVCHALARKDLILWNPSTKICKKLPDFDLKVNSGGYFVYGFGFDKSSDDYKVVALFNCSRDLSEVTVQVYSLRSDQWKMIKNFEGGWLMDDPATFVNGKLYWVVNHDHELGSGWNIVSLDLETEEFEMLHMPSYVKSGYYSRLGESDGCLYVLCSHLKSADLWITDDCRIGKGTWSKVVTIPYNDDFLKYTYKSVLYVLKNGQVLLLCSSTFVIFDPKDGSFRYPRIDNLGEFFAVGTYFESLVSLDG